MRIVFVFFIFLVPLFAQAADQATLQNVLSAVTYENNDGGSDRAVLVEDGYKPYYYFP